MAVFYKPRIGTRFIADFGVLQAHQGGAVVHLVEIETAHEALFTKAGRPAKRLASAALQIEDWRMWIEGASVHYAKELIDLATELPEIDRYQEGDRGFRLRSGTELEATWRAFGGFDCPVSQFSIIIGRWSSLTSDEKARLLNKNRRGAPSLRIYTYEQLARGANFRLERDDWYNENDQWGSINENVNLDDLNIE